MTLRNLFAAMDTDVNNLLSKEEFHRTMERSGMGLSGDEAHALFEYLDKNKSGTIGYADMVEQFSAYNTQE